MISFWKLKSLIFVSVPFVLIAQTDKPRLQEDLLTHRKVLNLVKYRRLLGHSPSVTSPSGMRELFSDEVKPQLTWISSYLSRYPLIYSVDDAVVTESYTLLAAANPNTRAKYFLVAFSASRTVLGIEPNADRNTVKIFDLKTNRGIEIAPFLDVEATEYVGVLGDTSGSIRDASKEDLIDTGRCIWNAITNGLRNSCPSGSCGWSDIARLVCNYRSASDDVKQMIDLGKSIGGCATGGWFDCGNAAIEISLLIATPDCRPAWMNTCFAGSQPTVTWTQKPRDFFQNGQTFPAQWQISGNSQTTYSHVHISLDRATVQTTGPGAIIRPDQGGSTGSYQQDVNPSNALSISLAPGAPVYFAVHASDGGSVNYYSDVVVSAVSGLTPPVIPHIDDVNPKTVPVGIETLFTLDGSGFQQGSIGKLLVGSNSYNVDPSKTTIVSVNRVQLAVRVGAVGEPTTAFRLQVVSGGLASNEYGGLTAQQASSAPAIPNLQITFSPNPVPKSSDGKWYYTVNVRETNGVGASLTKLMFAGNDYTQNIASWFKTNQIPANGQISGSFNTSGNAGDWPWTFSANGLTWSQSVTLQP